MKKEIVLAFLLVIFVVPMISAEILMGQPKTLYNVGDEFSIDITLKPNSNMNGLLVASLVCDSNSSGSVDLYKNSFSIKSGEEKVTKISAVLSNSLIGSLIGQCYISTSYGPDSANSQKFEISRDMYIQLQVDGIVFSPGEYVGIRGTAVKKNGQKVDGFVEVKVEQANAFVSKPATNGEFNFNFTLPKNSPPGTYPIEARVYERDNEGEISNEGSESISIEVKQLLERLDIAFNSQSVKPGEDLVYNIILYDQAGNQAEGDISSVIYKPGDVVFAKKLIKSGEENRLSVGLNFTPGYWRIEASMDDLSAKKLFYVQELQSAVFSLINDSLLIYNNGNVPYKKPVEVSIGGVVEIKQMNLGIGESKKFRLSAPNGEYSVKINDGENENVLGNAFLTGRAIGVGDYKLGEGATAKILPLLWILIIVVLGVAAFYLYKKVRKKNFYGQTPVAVGNRQSMQNSLVDRGEKQEAAVIALKLGNWEQIKGNEIINGLINRALLKAKESKAKIYQEGDFRLVILAPVVTKLSDNNRYAVKVAQDIYDILKEHNDKASQKIKFGLGVNTGSLIAEIKEGKFKFTSVGNTVSIAKKIAGHMHDGILMSENFQKKVISSVKSDKLPGLGAWKIKRIADHDKYSKFLGDFLNRQDK